MPFYKYNCTKCGDQFEVRKNMSDMQLQELCPKCGTLSEKIFEGFGGYIFKCDGAYGKMSK